MVDVIGIETLQSFITPEDSKASISSLYVFLGQGITIQIEFIVQLPFHSTPFQSFLILLSKAPKVRYFFAIRSVINTIRWRASSKK